MKIVRKKSNLVSKMMILAIILVLLMATGFAIFKTLDENHYFAERKFEELARKYYEETLYPKFLADHGGNNLGDEFAKYQSGFTVKLRQILNHELLEHNKDYRKVFETEAFRCNTNSSGVIFKARAPYGKTDYVADFKLNCNKH